MKNICVNVMAFIATMNVALFTACSDGDDPKTLSATPTELTFTANETQTQTVEITTNTHFWSVEKSDDWVKHSKSGNKLFISVQNYTNTIEARTATVTILAGEAQPVDITITQEAKIPNTFSIAPTSLSYDANEIGDRTVTITTDAESWDATTDADWITLSKQDQILNVFVSAENTATTSRTATITITAGDAPEITLEVTQAAVIFLYSEPDSLFFSSNKPSEQFVTISTNATNWDAIADSTWVKLIKQNNMLKVMISEKNTVLSPRCANIRITADKARDFILPVTQSAGVFLSATPASLSFGANDAGQKRVTITTTAESWDASADVSWITLSKKDNVLQVTVDKNETGSVRNAAVTITADDETTSILVTQTK